MEKLRQGMNVASIEKKIFLMIINDGIHIELKTKA